MKTIFFFVIMTLIFQGCKPQETGGSDRMPLPSSLKPEFTLDNSHDVEKLRGQLLYMPVYSNVPYHIVGVEQFDMSAFVAVHNTDLVYPITITNALYFNKMGQPVFDFLSEGRIILNPLETHDFYVPYEDKSGNGANFIIEWISDSLVCEPLVESVTVSLKPNQSVAVLSTGRVIRERR